MKKVLLIIILITISSYSSCQEIKGLVTYNQIINGDTIPFIFLPEVNVFTPVNFSTDKERMEFNLLVFNVKKAYPYAKVAAIKINEYNKMISNAKNNREKRRLMKLAEDDLKNKFGEEIKSLTFTQGKILMKLINRETGSSSYQIIKEYRGKFKVFIWQTVAKIWGYDLKSEYDPLGEDKAIEQVVLLIENGSV